jgi:hypothetical protein
MPQFPQQWKSRLNTQGDRVGGASAGGPAPAENAAPRSASAVLYFEPEALARAIVFHILDEGLAREVAADSVRQTIARLRRRGLRPAIRRSAWQMMTNHERLEWLLSESLTVPLMRPDDDVVLLGTKDDR